MVAGGLDVRLRLTTPSYYQDVSSKPTHVTAEPLPRQLVLHSPDLSLLGE